MEDTTKKMIQAVEQFNRAFNAHIVGAVRAAMTEDCIFESTSPSPDGVRYVGAEQVLAYLERFFAGSPDARFETEEMIVSGDRCIVQWVYSKMKEGKP